MLVISALNYVGWSTLEILISTEIKHYKSAGFDNAVYHHYGDLFSVYFEKKNTLVMVLFFYYLNITEKLNSVGKFGFTDPN